MHRDSSITRPSFCVHYLDPILVHVFDLQAAQLLDTRARVSRHLDQVCQLAIAGRARRLQKLYDIGRCEWLSRLGTISQAPQSKLVEWLSILADQAKAS